MGRYSGYVDISGTMGMAMLSHYMFVESEGNPSTDPVILWSNGGPGMSLETNNCSKS
jgi:carboxypeptidase C (cathepsin A)